MATVPGILYIGEHHAVGGNPGLPNVMDSITGHNLQLTLDRAVQRIVPDDSAGASTADSISFWPWYDGNAGTAFYQVTASSTTTATLVTYPGLAGPGFTTNEWAGRRLTELNTAPVSTIGFRNRMAVTSNTANVITFPATTAPTVGAIVFLGTGRFTDYHPIAGFVNTATEIGPSTRGGSSWFSTSGVGPDATLIRRLFEDVYNEAPYFHFFKIGSISPVSTGWADSPNNSQRAGYLTELALVTAAATAHGNTIEWREAIIDLSMADLIAAVSTPLIALLYQSRLQEMIAWLRSSAVTNNANLRIILVNHDENLWQTTAPSASHYWRGLHRAVAKADGNVGIVDMSRSRIGRQVGVADAPSTEQKYYSLAEYFRMGELMSDAILRLQQGTPAESEGGFPLYYLIGDSIMVGPATVLWVGESSSPLISGPTIGSLLRPSNQLMLNHGTGVLEVYEPAVNSNTAGTVTATSGPDLSFLAQLGIIHPDGFAVVKVATNSSAMFTEASPYVVDASGGVWMKSANENYSVLLACRDEAVAYINGTLDKQADCRGVGVSLGHNDHTTTGGGQAFADNLAQFVTELREDLTTRTSGPNFPISWRRPQLDAAGVVTAEMELVRAALETQADLDSQFGWFDADDLERNKADNLHETPDSSVEQGMRHFAMLQALTI